jgi:hypothetical protein
MEIRGSEHGFVTIVTSGCGRERSSTVVQRLVQGLRQELNTGAKAGRIYRQGERSITLSSGFIAASCPWEIKPSSGKAGEMFLGHG